MSMSSQAVILNDAHTIPSFGFNTGTINNDVGDTGPVLSALNAGYRLMVSGTPKGSGEAIGAALRLWGGVREEVYIVTQTGIQFVGDEACDPRRELEAQLALMGETYVDLYLLERNTVSAGDLQKQWRIMEELKAEGLAKSIGVADFQMRDISEIKKSWTIPPAVNKIEYHPYSFHSADMLALRTLLDTENIKVLGYGALCPLFRSKAGPVDAVVSRLGLKFGATEGQVLMAWSRMHSGGPAMTLASVLVNIAGQSGTSQSAQTAKLTNLKMSEADVEEIAEAGKSRSFHFSS